MKLYRNVAQHVKFCIWGLACEYIQFCQSNCPWLTKNCNFQLVSHIAQKVFNLRSLNFTGILISMWSCAPGVLLVDLLGIFWVIALDVANNRFIMLCYLFLESTNFTGIMINTSQWSAVLLGFACGFCFHFWLLPLT
jgi:hypothetical protein